MPAERIYSKSVPLPLSADLDVATALDGIIAAEGVPRTNAIVYQGSSHVEGGSIDEIRPSLGSEEITRIWASYHNGASTSASFDLFNSAAEGISELDAQSPDEGFLFRLESEVTALLEGAMERDSTTSEPPSFDDPSRWTETITVEEYRSLEVIIEEMQKLVDSAEIPDEERLRVQAAIDILSNTYREADTQSKRFEILPILKAVGKFVGLYLPSSVASWGAALDAIGKYYPTIRDAIESVIA